MQETKDKANSSSGGLFRAGHRFLEGDQRLDGCWVHAVAHRQVIGHVIAKEDQRPHVGERTVAARIGNIGVHAFEHEGVLGQVGAQAVAGMVGG